jgi:GNAT superfamily N-acetyltransferase
MLSGNKGGGALELPSGSGAFASGYPSASENYALFTDSADAADARAIVDFYEKRGLSFVAPIMPGTSKKVTDLLEFSGIKRVKQYTAMVFDLKNFSGEREECATKISLSVSDIFEWGDTVWHGFGGEPPLPPQYLAFVRHMAMEKHNSLWLLCDGENAVCTGLMHVSDSGSCGLYYLSTLPPKRRRGFARRLMNAMAENASHNHGEIFLLATEKGRPFYIDYGFTALANVPVYSADEDV